MNRDASASRLAQPDPASNGAIRQRDALKTRGAVGTTIASNVPTSRPRNRRPVSTLGEQELASTSGTSTPAGSRGVSPIPTKYPSRSASKAAAGNGVGGRLVVPEIPGRRGSPQPQGLGGIWEGGWMGSWTALQSIASTVLGGDIEASSTTIGGSKPATHRRKNSTAWGPDGLPKKKPDNIGFGTASDTEAKIRAKKMRGVLEGGDEDLNARKDANGNYKRRTSSDEARSTPAEEDAMVYIHHVQPSDTLAGVILKYNCEPSVFRKANRFWPNDSIQTKKVVVVPVDACTIRGRPCDSPVPGERGVDLLSPTPSAEDPPTFNNGATWPGVSPQVGTSTANAKSEDQPWVHVRWVLIDSSPFSKPAEIARMPRKTLGYFPPRRRKSQGSVVSTPRASMDFSSFSQSPPSHRGTPPSRVGTTSGGSYFPPPAIRPGRPRRESVSEAADRLGWMRGPGGVGTLTGKNVRKPGPSQDGLNAWAKKHVPGLAIDFLPSASLVGGETARFGFDGSEEPMRALTPGPGGTSGIVTPSGAGLGIENAVAAAAAIEGWVRRLAIKPGTPRMTGRAQESDSIELLDGAGSDDGRCELTPRGRLVTVGALCDTDDVVRRGKGKKGD